VRGFGKATIRLFTLHASLIILKLRAFTISFSAANPCEARNRCLSLRSSHPTNDRKENQDYLATAGSSRLSGHRYVDGPQRATLNRPSPTQLTKPNDESQTSEMFVSFRG